MSKRGIALPIGRKKRRRYDSSRESCSSTEEELIIWPSSIVAPVHYETDTGESSSSDVSDADAIFSDSTEEFELVAPMQGGGLAADSNIESSEESESEWKTPGNVRLISEGVDQNEKFLLTRYGCLFAIDSLEHIADPEEVLLEAFEYCIREACKRSPAKVTRFCLYIHSDLLDYPIWIGLRSLEQNTAEAVLNQFLKTDQSKKETNLFGAPVQVEIMTVAEREGTGRPRNSVRHSVNENAIIRIENVDNNYCLFYAISLTKAFVTKELTPMQFSRLMRNPDRQLDMAHALMRNAGIPFGQQTYTVERHLQQVQDYFKDAFGSQYRLSVFESYGKYRPSFKGQVDNPTYEICLWRDGSHFHGIKYVNNFFRKSHFCMACERPYDRPSEHSAKCVIRCAFCAGIGVGFPCKSDGVFREVCSGCNKSFLNASCYQRHQENRMCDTYKRCLACGQCYNAKKLATKEHVCGTAYCRVCCCYHSTERGCYISPAKRTTKLAPYRFIFYDTECSQCLQPDPTKKRFLHEVLFICAQIACTQCIEDGTWYSKSTECRICEKIIRQHTWCASKDPNPIASFVEWVFSFSDKYKTLVMSHNGGRYDNIIALGEIYRQNLLTPSITRTGNRIYEIRIPRKKGAVPETIWRDSYNLMPLPLARLVDAFDLPVKDKDAYFPYLWINRENFSRSLPHLPDKKYYLSETYHPDKRQKFEAYYAANYNTPFDLAQKLEEYCCNDVSILRCAVIKFRSLVMQQSRDDSIFHCSTIAGLSMRHFRLNHLKPETVALVPERGYEKRELQSDVALKYLQWWSQENGLDVRTRDSAEGEYKIGRYKVDGFVPRLPLFRNLAIEILGCYFHGCLKCLKADVLCANGKTAELNHALTLFRINELRKELEVLTVWECQISKALKKEKRMRDFFENCEDTGAIDPRREAFFGGRTGPLCLYASVEDNQDYEISYMDIQSMYPAVNFYSSYPKGHPQVHVLNESVEWTEARCNPYKGLLKVRVLPPKHLLLPVLAVKFDNERLLFPLCRACAIYYRKRNSKNAPLCSHSDDERSFTVTVTHMELNESLDEGYLVTRVYRVWEWTEFDDTLFKGYIREMMTLKVTSSGWPAGATTPEAKKAFIRENQRRYGITIDPAKVEWNPGARELAKLRLNTLWGRFSLQNTLARDLVTPSPAEFCNIVHDPRYDVHSVEPVNEEAVCVTYTTKTPFVKEHASSNVVISLWTTSAARLRLYRHMRDVVRTPGCTLLYSDTDSVIYKHPKGLMPIETGEYLGQMTNEMPHHKILTFVSGGAKQYGLKYCSRTDPSDVKYKLRLRGITLDSKTSEIIHFDSLKDQVMAYNPDKSIRITYERAIRADRRGQVRSVEVTRQYRPICQKGYIKGHDVFPFGYIPPENDT